MIERKTLSALMFLLLALFNTCEYEPHKVYERNVDENVTAPEITVVELNLDYDTIFLYAQKEIHFNFRSDNQEIKAVRFSIDTTEQYIENSGSGIYNLDYRIFTNGIHTLLLEVYTASGSGSIAEAMGAEGFLFSKTWILYIDQNYSFNMKSSVSDGFLKLYWNRYRGYDFKEYVVYRETGWNTKTEIARLHSNTFIDSSYVGEKVRYDVEVIQAAAQILPWGFLELEKDLQKLHLAQPEGNDFRVIWNKNKYYGAVDTFSLSLSTNYGGSYSKIKETHNPDDTSHAITTVPFGSRIDLILRVVPKKKIHYNPGNYSLFESYLENLTLGFPFDTRSQITSDISQVSRDEFIYFNGCDSIIRYSVSQKHIIEKLGYAPTGCHSCSFSRIRVSPSGALLTTYVDCMSNVMLANSNSFGSKNVRDLKFLTGQMYVPEIPVSDVGIMMVYNKDGGFYLYNFNTDSTLAFYDKPVFIDQGVSISMNGDYLFLLDDSLRLVHYHNSGFINIWSHSRYFDPVFHEFDGVNPDRVIIWDGSTFAIKHCSDFSTIIEFPLTDELVLDIDYFNNRMLTWSTGFLKIRSLTDGSLIQSVAFALNPASWYNACYLVDNAIVCAKGVIYFFE